MLSALAVLCGGANQLTAITIAIDKLDKIGSVKVKEELIERGLDESQVALIDQYLGITGSNTEKLSLIRELIGHIDIGKEGIAELTTICESLTEYQSTPVIDFTLARGLNYYTGTIFEVKANEVSIGSIGGGGRYDDLTGLFGVPNIPGVGISFGVDRIYDVLEELKLFPENVHKGTQVLFFNFGELESKRAFAWMQQLRSKNVRSEIYPETIKMDKQFKYAERKHIPFVVIIGSKELENNTCVLKDLGNGEQHTLTIEELTARVY